MTSRPFKLYDIDDLPPDPQMILIASNATTDVTSENLDDVRN